MHLEFLTEKFLLKEHNFNSPVIVTGSGGCIGSWILSILHRSGIPCVGIDLSNKKDRLELILGKEAAEIKWEACDITNFSILKNIIINYNWIILIILRMKIIILDIILITVLKIITTTMDCDNNRETWTRIYYL